MDKKWDKLIEGYDLHCQRIVKLSTLKFEETPAQQRARIKELEADYIKWFEYYFTHYAKAKCAWFHKKLAKLIIQSKSINLMAEMFRSAAKSVHIDMGIPLYLYLVKKDLFFMLLVGETDPKAKRLIGDIQAELEVNPRIINDYGKRFKAGDWKEGDFLTTDGVRFQSFSFGSSTRGMREGANRPDYIVVDDVDNKRHVNNDKLMTDSVDYILEEIMGLFDAADETTERFVYANNNFHKNSITNRLKTKFKESAKAEIQDYGKTNHIVFTVNAVKDLISFEPNWPEKTTADFWRRKYRSNRRAFLRERMNTHVVDGKMFKPEYMRWGKMLPYEEYDALCFYGDLSYKDQGDYKALVLVGKKGREFHIIHCFLRQVSRREAAAWLYDLYKENKLYNYNIIYKIEGLFAQDEFINDFDEEGDERGYYIPVIADKKPKEGKHDRIESILGWFEKLRVYWNVEEKESTDQVDAIDQFTGFEKGSKLHDDFPDATHGGFREVQELSMPERSEPQTNSRADSQSSKHRS